MNSYEIRYERVTGSQQLLCTDYEHSGTVSVGGNDTEYTLTELQEYSIYSITVVAVVDDYTRGVGGSAELREVTTLQAGTVTSQD